MNQQGTLCEYSKPHKAVATKWRSPAATGYEVGLYTVPGAPAKDSQHVEKYVMGIIDTWASKAHQVLLSWRLGGRQDLSQSERFGWVAFLHSLALRTPEQIASMQTKLHELLPEVLEGIRDEYNSKRRENDPESFEEFKLRYIANPANTSPLLILSQTLFSETVLPAMAEMKFNVFRVPETMRPNFLTSDRPFVMTNGIAQPDAHIAIPISPTMLFVAERNERVQQYFRSIPIPLVVKMVNSKIVEQAQKYVYGTDASQRRFVQNRLGRKLQASPIG